MSLAKHLIKLVTNKAFWSYHCLYEMGWTGEMQSLKEVKQRFIFIFLQVVVVLLLLASFK